MTPQELLDKIASTPLNRQLVLTGERDQIYGFISSLIEKEQDQAFNEKLNILRSRLIESWRREIVTSYYGTLGPMKFCRAYCSMIAGIACFLLLTQYIRPTPEQLQAKNNGLHLLFHSQMAISFIIGIELGSYLASPSTKTLQQHFEQNSKFRDFSSSGTIFNKSELTQTFEEYFIKRKKEQIKESYFNRGRNTLTLFTLFSLSNILNLSIDPDWPKPREWDITVFCFVSMLTSNNLPVRE